MSFLDTEPAAIQRLDTAGPWARFKVNDPRLREATLRELRRGDVPLTLGRAGGFTLPTVLWSVDEVRQVLHLNVAAGVPFQSVASAIAVPELWAAGYLQEAKVQFDVRGLTVDNSGSHTMLHARMPRTLLHLPRRRTVRVRRNDPQSPGVCFRHPLLEAATMRWPVLDISMSGCALRKPAGTPALMPGIWLQAVEVALDDDAIFFADLTVQHVTVGAGSAPGVRVGCAWQGLSTGAAETLQSWILRGRRRRDLVSLTFD